MTKEEIGLILKELRIKSDMTQKQVAQVIGRTQQVVGHWETGYSQPDADTLFVLCELYNASVDDAFGFTKKSKKHEHSLSDEDIDIIKKYRSLDLRGQKAVLDTLNRECEFAVNCGSTANSAALISDAIRTVNDLAGVTAAINQHKPTSKK